MGKLWLLSSVQVPSASSVSSQSGGTAAGHASSEQESWCEWGAAKPNLDSSDSAVVPGPCTGQWQGLQKAIVISCLGSRSGFGKSLALPDGGMCSLRLVEHMGMLIGSLQCEVCWSRPAVMLGSWVEELYHVSWHNWRSIYKSHSQASDQKILFTAFIFNCWDAFLVVVVLFFPPPVICFSVTELVYTVLSVPLVSDEMEIERKKLCLPLET